MPLSPPRPARADHPLPCDAAWHSSPAPSLAHHVPLACTTDPDAFALWEAHLDAGRIEVRNPHRADTAERVARMEQALGIRHRETVW